MRVIVFFDLPITTINERREYRRFRRFLIKNGFIMMQESVYSKLALNSNAANAIIYNIRKEKPSAGLVQLLSITERQFSSMEFIIGDSSGEILDSTERFVVL